MLNQPSQKYIEHHLLPPVGQRIIKTSIAVLICLLISYLRGNVGSAISTEASITAIICLQPYVRDARKYAADRFIGTLAGALTGLFLLGFFYLLPGLFTGTVLLYVFIAAGAGLAIYVTVVLRIPDTASLAAIVCLCIVITFPEIESPVRQVVNRILDVFIGTSAAILVNIFRLPRDRQKNKVIFIRASDLTADRFTPVSRTVLFRLNRLYEDGAKICLELEHAPAFFLLQMSTVRLNVPMIVMDGAAIYDFNEGEYLHLKTLGTEELQAALRIFEKKSESCFIYTVQNNQTCIFHRGEMRKEEREVYIRMKRSPYRNYLEGDSYDPEKVVYLKAVDQKEVIYRLYRILSQALDPSKVRLVIRRQFESDDILGLYLYSARSSMEQAEEGLMEKMRKEDPHFTSVRIHASEGCHSERDALRLLHEAEKEYAPIRF